MGNKFKRFMSTAVILAMLAVPNTALGETGKETELFKADFNEGYTATKDSPAIPSAVSGTLNNGGLIYADTVDDEHGVSLAIEDSSGVAPWIGTKPQYAYTSPLTDCSVRVSFDIMSKEAKASANMKMLGASDGKAVWVDLIALTTAGKITYSGVTESNAVSAEIYTKYSSFTKNTWYHFDIVLDLVNQKYTVYVGIAGADPEKVAEGIDFNNSVEGLASMRLTVRGNNTNLRFDNFYMYQMILLPELVGIEYSEGDGNVQLTFNKKMDYESLGTKIKLLMSTEEVEVPFTGSSENKVYTLATGTAFKKGVTYTLKFTGSIFCADGEELTVDEDYVFTIPAAGTSVSASDVTFASGSGTVTANVNLPAEITEPSVNLVLGAYKGDTLVDVDVLTLSAGAVTSPVTLSCTADGIDGAGVYVLDSAFVPLCDAVVMKDSNITAGVRSESVPGSFAQMKYDSVSTVVTVYGYASPGEMITVISAQGSTIDLTNPAAIRQVMAKENGYYEVTFKNDTGKSDDAFKFPSDDYAILVKSETQEKTLSYKYSNSVEAVAALVEVKKAKTVDEIANIIKNYSKIFALDKTDYETVNKTSVHKLILTEKLAAYTTGGEFKNAFDRAVCLALINKGADVLKTLKNYAAEFGLDPDELSTLPDTELAVEIIVAENYTSFERFLAVYEEAKILSNISSASNATKMKTYLMTTYSEELNLLDNKTVADKYEDITEKTAVFGKLLDIKFKSVSDLKTAFNEAVSEVYESENSEETSGGSGSFGGGGGGSGGGGGKGTVGTGSAVINTVVSNPATKDETTQIKFTDIEEKDSEMLCALVEKGVIVGDGDGKFRPADMVRRDEIMKMIVIGLKMENTVATSAFSDVSSDNWAYPYISAAYSKGIVNGVGDNRFAPELNVSIQDSVTMLYRAAYNSGLIAQYENLKNDTLIADAAEISDYAAEAVKFVYGYIMETDASGKVRPKENATRLEVATLVYKFMQFMEGGM